MNHISEKHGWPLRISLIYYLMGIVLLYCLAGELPAQGALADSDTSVFLIVSNYLGIEAERSALPPHSASIDTRLLISQVMPKLRDDISYMAMASMRLPVSTKTSADTALSNRVTNYVWFEVTYDTVSGRVCKVSSNPKTELYSMYIDTLNALAYPDVKIADDRYDLRVAAKMPPVTVVEAIDSIDFYITNGLVQLDAFPVQYEWLASEPRPATIPADSIPVWLFVFKRLDAQIITNQHGAEIMQYKPHIVWDVVDVWADGPRIRVERRPN